MEQASQQLSLVLPLASANGNMKQPLFLHPMIRLSQLLLVLALAAQLLPSCKCNKEQNVTTTDSLVVPYLNDPTVKAITDDIRNDPKNAEPYFNRAVVFHRMNEVVPAFTDIKKAIELDSTKAKYYFLQADIMLSDGYAEGAIRSLQRILQLDPNNNGARIKLAKTLLYAGDRKASLTEVQKLLESDRTNFEPYFIAGLNYKELGDTAKAIESFKLALQYKPEFYDAYMQLGLLTSKMNSPEAPLYFDNAIRLDSTQPESYYAKAKYFQDHKRYDEAKKIYRLLIRISPQNEKAFFNLGFVYLLQDSVDKAFRHFDLAIKMKPNYADAYYYRGLAESERGNKAEAKTNLTQCLALDPENEKAQSLLNTLNKQ